MKDSGIEENVATGFRGLDGEHRLQLDLLTAFRNAVAEGRSPAEVDELLDRLIDYTQVHFRSEQTLMRLYQYPHYAQHTNDHDDTIESLQAIRRTHMRGEDALAVGAAERLAESLTRHIVTADRALGFFLVRLGVGPG